MPSINIHFHMLFEELVEFVTYVSSKYILEIELERFFPKASLRVSFNSDLRIEIDAFGQVDRFWLLYKPPKGKKCQKFMINVGRQRGDRLAQGQLGAGTDDSNAFSVLKKIALELKHRTSGGIWVVTETGNLGYVKEFRISEGATKASRSNQIKLVSPVFTQSFHVDQPTDLEP